MLKVKLIHDYTKYNEELKKGILGYAFLTPEEQAAKTPNDNFVKVKFDGITEVDVLWRGLEIVDEKYLEEKRLEKANYFTQLKTAKNVRLTVGPSGGFKSLEFDCVLNNEDTHKVITEKDVGNEHVAEFEAMGINVKTIQLEKKISEKKKK